MFISKYGVVLELSAVTKYYIYSISAAAPTGFKPFWGLMATKVTGYL